MELDKGRARAILDNWARWAKDCPPDPAEVHYYTICPDFRGVVKGNPAPAPYNPEAAELVEDVFRRMFVPYKPERKLLCEFYLRNCNVIDFAARSGFSKDTLYRRLDLAMKAFVEMWDEMGGKGYFVA